MSLFPSIQTTTAAYTQTQALPMAEEVKWDFARNVPVFRDGRPLTVTGKEAVKVWIWKALHTRRFVHQIYSYNYGCDIYRLIGQTYTLQLKETEAARYIRECLLINKYITAVRNVDVSFADALLTISCTVDTIYGEVGVTTNV